MQFLLARLEYRLCDAYRLKMRLRPSPTRIMLTETRASCATCALKARTASVYSSVRSGSTTNPPHSTCREGASVHDNISSGQRGVRGQCKWKWTNTCVVDSDDASRSDELHAQLVVQNVASLVGVNECEVKSARLSVV